MGISVIYRMRNFDDTPFMLQNLFLCHFVISDQCFVNILSPFYTYQDCSIFFIVINCLIVSVQMKDTSYF